MGLDIGNIWCLDVTEEIDLLTKCLDEKIINEQQQLIACKKKTELETKLAQELKLNNELTERLAELSRRGGELDRVCATFESHLTIADSDKNRLDNAKETYQLAKELTGIRLDFRATGSFAKGYIKSDARKVLQPFEVPAGDSEALWALVKATASPGLADKENTPMNEDLGLCPRPTDKKI